MNMEHNAQQPPDQQQLLQTIEQQRDALRQQQDAIAQQQNALRQQSEELAFFRANTNNTPAPEPLRSKEPKLPNVTPFSGRHDSDYRGFMVQLDLVFELNPARFPSDRTKIAYLGTLLVGPALKWYTPLAERPEEYQHHLSDWSSFKSHMTATFGQADPTRHANQALRRLQQGRSSVQHYSTLFRQMAVESDWSESNKREGFIAGLSDEIQDRMLSHPEEKTLEGTMHLAIRIEERLAGQRLRKKNNIPIQRHTAGRFGSGFPRTTAPSAANGPSPMDLDSLQTRGPLSREERSRRQAQSLCYFCGKEGHYKNNCPEKKQDFSKGQ
jgi:hypothetical protein